MRVCVQVTPVRNAAKDAMEAIVNNMSGHATAFVLPMLYEAMLSTKWMTKQGALQLLSVLSKAHSRQVCMASRCSCIAGSLPVCQNFPSQRSYCQASACVGWPFRCSVLIG